MEHEQQYVGIDLHRRRSVIVRRTQSGETLETVRINNDREALAVELAKAGEHPEVILEATYGWYWAVDVLEECGATVHLSHPLGNNWGNRRVKNDERDATDLVDLFRLGRLAEAWIAPPKLREVRELVRYQGKPVHLRSNFKAQVHSVLAKEGVLVPMSDLFGMGGQALLDHVRLGDAYRIRVESLRDLIELADREIAMLEKELAPFFADDLGFWAVQAIPGVGPVLAANSLPRSGTSQDSRAPDTCAAGPASPQRTTSPTRRSAGATSPSRVLASCAGQRSRRWRTNVPIPRSDSTTAAWANAGASRSGTWRPPANFSSSSTTAYATVRSAAWLRPGENRDGRSPVRARRISWLLHVSEAAPLIEPTGLRPEPLHPTLSRRTDERHPGSRAAQPALLALEQDRNTPPPYMGTNRKP